MISPRRPLTDDLKMKILREKEHYGSSIYSIAKKYDRSPSTIRCFLKCYYHDQQLSRKRGRKPKMTEEIKEFISRFGMKNEVSCRKIAIEVKRNFPDVSLSKETVRVIRQKQKRQQLSPLSTTQPIDDSERSLYTNKMLSNDLPVIFSNTFLMGVDQNGLLTRTSCSTSFPIQTAFSAEGNPMEIMVWAAISTVFKSDLILIEDELDLESILIENKIPEILKKKHGPFILAGNTSSLIGQLSYFGNHFKTPEHGNPINDLFQTIQQNLFGKRFKTKQELFMYVSHMWGTISQQKIVSTCNYFTQELHSQESVLEYVN
ncbi:Tc3 transposase DNA binding domain-containing protein [Entamoeba marina]